MTKIKTHEFSDGRTLTQSFLGEIFIVTGLTRTGQEAFTFIVNSREYADEMFELIVNEELKSNEVRLLEELFKVS